MRFRCSANTELCCADFIQTNYSSRLLLCNKCLPCKAAGFSWGLRGCNLQRIHHASIKTKSVRVSYRAHRTPSFPFQSRREKKKLWRLPGRAFLQTLACCCRTFLQSVLQLKVSVCQWLLSYEAFLHLFCTKMCFISDYEPLRSHNSQKIH